MSVTTLPTLGFSPQDRQTAAAWAARRGSGWCVETIPTDDGRAGLGVSTPWSDDPADPARAGLLEFQIQRTPAGIVAFDARTWEALGSFATVVAALDAGADAAGAARAVIPANDP